MGAQTNLRMCGFISLRVTIFGLLPKTGTFYPLMMLEVYLKIS